MRQLSYLIVKVHPALTTNPLHLFPYALSLHAFLRENTDGQPKLATLAIVLGSLYISVTAIETFGIVAAATVSLKFNPSLPLSDNLLLVTRRSSSVILSPPPRAHPEIPIASYAMNRTHLICV